MEKLRILVCSNRGELLKCPGTGAAQHIGHLKVEPVPEVTQTNSYSCYCGANRQPNEQQRKIPQNTTDFKTASLGAQTQTAEKHAGPVRWKPLQ